MVKQAEKADKAAAEKAEPKRSKDPRPCQCFTEQIGSKGETPVYGPCSATTHKRFAMGHDARFKGILLRLHRANQQLITQVDGKQKAQAPTDVLIENGWIAKASDADGKSRPVPKTPEERAAADQARADARKVKADEKAVAAEKRKAEAAAKKAATPAKKAPAKAPATAAKGK